MNLLIKENGVLVSQATKDGYIFCEWGGGIRYELSDIHKAKRKSSGKRDCISGNYRISNRTCEDYEMNEDIKPNLIGRAMRMRQCGGGVSDGYDILHDMCLYTRICNRIHIGERR